MPRKGSPYGPRYQKVRQALLGAPCEMRILCDGDPATTADHDPPISRHNHIEGAGCCRLRPGCQPCQYAQARQLAGQTARFKKLGIPVPDLTINTSTPNASRNWA